MSQAALSTDSVQPPKAAFLRREGRAFIVAMVIAATIFSLSVNRIDFHADEAIYLQGIPVNVSNDSGLLYNTAYLLTSWGEPTPLSARITSLLFGLVLITCVTRIGVLLVPEKSVMLAVVIPLSIAISYQGVFSILRVRPEISWLTMSAVCCWCLAELKRHDSPAMRAALLIALALLPMNHMLSWFACLFVAGYIGLFARTRFGWKMCLACFAALATGVVINSAVRSWIVTGDISLFPKLNSPGAGTGQSLKEFLWNVFWNSPNFLNDTALGKNWWNRILPGPISQSASHCLVATLLWAVALPLPLLMRSWESRYAAAVPLLTLVLFYGSGYFNPTYTPLLVVYALLISVYVSASSSFVRPVRFGAAAIVVISFINGGSFLSTRVLNHGRATFFSVESDIRGEVSRLPAGCTIAVAERFQSVVRPGIDKKVILFKDKLPADVDLVILDNYDYDMYRFVPEYEQRRAEIDAVRKQFTEVFAYDRPVYNRDAIRPEALAAEIAAMQGSWFFRNSVKYRVFGYGNQPIVEHTAGRSMTAHEANQR